MRSPIMARHLNTRRRVVRRRRLLRISNCGASLDQRRRAWPRQPKVPAADPGTSASARGDDRRRRASIRSPMPISLTHHTDLTKQGAGSGILHGCRRNGRRGASEPTTAVAALRDNYGDLVELSARPDAAISVLQPGIELRTTATRCLTTVIEALPPTRRFRRLRGRDPAVSSIPRFPQPHSPARSIRRSARSYRGGTGTQLQAGGLPALRLQQLAGKWRVPTRRREPAHRLVALYGGRHRPASSGSWPPLISAHGGIQESLRPDDGRLFTHSASSIVRMAPSRRRRTSALSAQWR